MKVVIMVPKKGTVQYFCPLFFVQGNRQND